MNTKHNQRRGVDETEPVNQAEHLENRGGKKLGELFATPNISTPDFPEFSEIAGEKPGEFLTTSRISDSPGIVKKRGRPSIVDEPLKEQICLLLSLGLSRRQAAAYSNTTHVTIANAIQREPEFAERVDRAEQMSVAKPILTIADLSRKNWRAAVWLLTRNERRLVKDDEELEQEHSAMLQQSRETAEHLKALEQALKEPTR